MPIELTKLTVLLLIGLEGAFTQVSRMERAKNILQETPLIDGHNDLPYNLRTLVDNKLESFRLDASLKDVEPWSHHSYSQTDIPRMRQGLVGAQFWAVFLKCTTQELNPIQLALEQIDVIKRMVEKYREHFMFVTTRDGIRESFRRGRIGSLLGLEGGHMIRSSLGTLRMMYELGVRYMTLTHTCSTPWATTCVVESEVNMKDEGLSQFGRTVVYEMNRMGMMVDLSHVSAQTMRDAIDSSLAPVIFSHSGARAICGNPRNVPDDVLRKVKENGGLVMLTFFDLHIKCEGNSTMHDVIAHLNHIRNVAGINHVGIGADYDGVTRTPKGLEDASKYPFLIAELLKDPSWTEESIRKLIGENLLRVFGEVERIRDSLSGTLPREDSIPREDQRGFSNCTYFFHSGSNKGGKNPPHSNSLVLLCAFLSLGWVSRGRLQ